VFAAVTFFFWGVVMFGRPSPARASTRGKPGDGGGAPGGGRRGRGRAAAGRAGACGRGARQPAAAGMAVAAGEAGAPAPASAPRARSSSTVQMSTGRATRLAGSSAPRYVLWAKPRCAGCTHGLARTAAGQPGAAERACCVMLAGLWHRARSLLIARRANVAARAGAASCRQAGCAPASCPGNGEQQEAAPERARKHQGNVRQTRRRGGDGDDERGG